ncbi:zinc finger protein 718-like isoform X2 [Belonocnema kinseyi]|uniref:zinc finger protein 718-like isoform X2 n=1 Tax=Belonocnema kinseyi TaxID=2817044 RepID=UPI00143D5C8C|nr:zinc finger protein 718-like isoform X2 [Belonocnema kinseyi]
MVDNILVFTAVIFWKLNLFLSETRGKSAIFFSMEIIEYDIDDTLEIKEEIIQDLQIKSESKKSGGRSDGGPYCFKAPDIIFMNASTLVKSEIEETLDINEEIIQDSETADQERDKISNLKVCTVDIKGNYILPVKKSLRRKKNHTGEESKNEKRYKCEKCARSYKWSENLRRHKKFECGVMPQFTCQFCGNQFSRKCNMKSHIDIVHFKTSNRSILQKLKRKHNSLKGVGNAADVPHFICDICDYKSKRKDYLLNHMKSRHSLKPKTKYNCDKCSRSYSWICDLNRHKQLKHAEVKPQVFCDFCGHKTNMKSSLAKHIIARHLNKSYSNK